jgi:thioredoxin-related protein
MKKVQVSIVLLLFAATVFSQDLSKFNLYKPAEDAELKITEAVKTAKATGKHVFVQIGGNWCIWCARFNEFVTSDTAIDSLINTNYVVYHMNYSPENKNSKLLSKYNFPQRFGFPVFLVLDGTGKLLHTQNSSYLEQGKGYSKSIVMGFFNDWSPAALKPAQYKD